MPPANNSPAPQVARPPIGALYLLGLQHPPLSGVLKIVVTPPTIPTWTPGCLHPIERAADRNLGIGRRDPHCGNGRSELCFLLQLPAPPWTPSSAGPRNSRISPLPLPPFWTLPSFPGWRFELHAEPCPVVMPVRLRTPSKNNGCHVPPESPRSNGPARLAGQSGIVRYDVP